MSTVMAEDLFPGVYVRHPDRPEWGIGQVQSVTGHRITVNFEHTGKLLINGQMVVGIPALEEVLSRLVVPETTPETTT